MTPVSRFRSRVAAVSIALSCAVSFSLTEDASAESIPSQAPPWLGVALENGKVGVLVKSVVAGSPAEAAGLEAGDEITAVANVPVKGPTDVISTVRGLAVGRTVRVDFERGGKAQSKMVKLAARPDPVDMMRKKIVGKPVPAFALEAISGSGPTSAAGLKGQVVVLEFWATWCGACRSTHEKLSEFTKSRRGKGITVLAVSDEETADIQAYADAVKPEFTIARDKSRSLFDPWMVSALPTLVVIDKTGNVAFATVGGGSDFEEALAQADKLAQAK